MEAEEAAGAVARGAASAGRFAYGLAAAAAFGRVTKDDIIAKLSELLTCDEGSPKKNPPEGGAERRTG